MTCRPHLRRCAAFAARVGRCLRSAERVPLRAPQDRSRCPSALDTIPAAVNIYSLSCARLSAEMCPCEVVVWSAGALRAQCASYRLAKIMWHVR